MTSQPEQGIKRELSLGEVLSKTFELYRRDFTKYFVLFAVVGVIIVHWGLNALIVPEMILAIIFSLAFTRLLMENKGVPESMGRSRKLGSPRWHKPFATFLLLGYVIIIPSAIVTAISEAQGVA